VEFVCIAFALAGFMVEVRLVNWAWVFVGVALTLASLVVEIWSVARARCFAVDDVAVASTGFGVKVGTVTAAHAYHLFWMALARASLLVEVGIGSRTRDEVLIALALAFLLVEVREVRWALLFHAFACAALCIEVRSGARATFDRLVALARASI